MHTRKPLIVAAILATGALPGYLAANGMMLGGPGSLARSFGGIALLNKDTHD
jgi:hypothetical protein